jgi:glutamate synthase (NADPH/NADH) small chain
LDDRGNIKGINQYQTTKDHIFTAGDCRRGQSLIVWAISEGREAAHQVDTYLMGQSKLPQKNKTGDLVSA